MANTLNQRLELLARAFSTHRAISSPRQFVERPQQFGMVADALLHRGMHIAIYGERGTGKTSLIKVLPSLLKDAQRPVPRTVIVNCNSESTYETLWNDALIRLNLRAANRNAPSISQVISSLDKLTESTMVVFDEMDRMDGEHAETARSLLADTAKSLTDNSEVRLCLVGVADDFNSLLGDHQSIGRSIKAVEMLRMTQAECEEIIRYGYSETGLTIDEVARYQIVKASEGLPFCIHYIAERAAQRAVQDQRSAVAISDVKSAINSIVCEGSLYEEEYHQAIGVGDQRVSPDVLLACAYAKKDIAGRFEERSVVVPLGILRGVAGLGEPAEHSRVQVVREVVPGDFESDLHVLVERQVMRRSEGGGGRKFAFRNPLLQNFVKWQARMSGAVSSKAIEELERHQGDVISITDTDVAF